MGGHHSHPLGWTALALVVVAYAHVILELAVAVLALVIAARIVSSTAPRMLNGRLCRERRIGRRSDDVIATERSTLEPAARRRTSERSPADEV